MNGGKQAIRHRIQKNGNKDAEVTHRLQGTEWELQQYEKGNRNYKKEPNRNEEYNLWNLKKKTERITSRLDEAEDQISELEDKIERNTQVEQSFVKKTQKICR